MNNFSLQQTKETCPYRETIHYLSYMKNLSSYLKMRVLAAIGSAPGKTQGERVRNIAHMVFVDEYGKKRQFTFYIVG
jgi:hypothetical protein